MNVYPNCLKLLKNVKSTTAEKAELIREAIRHADQLGQHPENYLAHHVEINNHNYDNIYMSITGKLPPKYNQAEDFEYTEEEAIRRLKQLHK